MVPATADAFLSAPCGGWHRMSTIAVVDIDTEEFALGQSLPSVPDLEFEVVRVAAHDDSRLVPYVRVQSNDPASFEDLDDLIEEDPSVAEARLLDDLGNERLYRMEWIQGIVVTAHILLDEGGTILRMHGQEDYWRLRVLLPEREALSRTDEFCRDKDLSFEIRNIYELSESVGSAEYGLTESQFEVLVTAAELGYFDVPRRVTMGELADHIGISQQAASERLRRGHQNLVDNALRVGDLAFRHDTADDWQ
jgi:hypothetical protein